MPNGVYDEMPEDVELPEVYRVVRRIDGRVKALYDAELTSRLDDAEDEIETLRERFQKAVGGALATTVATLLAVAGWFVSF